MGSAVPACPPLLSALALRPKREVALVALRVRDLASALHSCVAYGAAKELSSAVRPRVVKSCSTTGRPTGTGAGTPAVPTPKSPCTSGAVAGDAHSRRLSR